MKRLKILVVVRSEGSPEIFQALKSIDFLPEKIAFAGIPAHVKLYVFHDTKLTDNVVAGAAKACYPEAWLTKAFRDNERDSVLALALQDAVNTAEDVILFLGSSVRQFVEDALTAVVDGAEIATRKGVTACGVKHFTGANRTPLTTKLRDAVGTIP